jgi:hypothetical protein
MSDDSYDLFDWLALFIFMAAVYVIVGSGGA